MKTAASYQDEYSLKPGRLSSHSQIVDMIESNSSVLDVGCGKGILSRALFRKNCKVVGIDRQEPDLSFTQFMTEYHRQDLESQFPKMGSTRFDYVIVADVLEHLRNREELLKAIRGYLKPNGFLIASTGNIALFVYRFLLLYGRFEYGKRGILDEDHVHLFTITNFAVLLRKAGYDIMSFQYTPIPFELIIEQRKLTRLLLWAYQKVVLLWPSLFAYQVVAKVKARVPG